MPSDLPQDEARRALANSIEIAVFARRLQGDAIMPLTLEFAAWQDVIAALRADPVRAAEEMIAFLLREAEPTLSRHGDEIILQCPDGTITDDLCDAIEAAICPLPTQPATEGGADA